MIITLNIDDDRLTQYSTYITPALGAAPSTSDEWSIFFEQQVIPDYMEEKFGVSTTGLSFEELAALQIQQSESGVV